MKNYIIISLLFIGCSGSPIRESSARNVAERSSVTVIDSCEYLTYPGYGGCVTFTHKGNCKYCKQRNK